MTVRGVQRIVVSVADRERALILYRDALGLTEKYTAGEVVALTIPGSDTELLLHERPPTPGLAGVAVSFLVSDVDVSTAAAEKAGARIIDAPDDQPWGERQSVFTDPDGHVICLVSALTSQ
ncbi:VOC family protein [Actinoplanes sp. TFC3]|uniref:VOC family protein n=1 Tax=Actinoplanes sp. TFC3 TaxID=1710355 RepID=UPI0008340836|nr:VOC family protein [Actinoplanes sp. TFC3]